MIVVYNAARLEIIMRCVRSLAAALVALLFVSLCSSVTAQTATLISISVAPATVSLQSGGTQQFIATGNYSDGSIQNITGAATWSSSNSTVLTIGYAGMGTALAPGSATVEARQSGIVGQASVTVTDTNLVGWWRFTEGTGTTAADATGHGYTAQLANGIVWVSGQAGGAIQANGTSQYVTIPAIDLSGTKAITWTTWVNRTWGSSLGTLIEASANFNNSNTAFGFFPGDASDCGSPDMLMTGVDGNVGYTLNCYAQPTSSTWHHLALVLDKSQAGSSVISLYLDGALQTPARQLTTATNTNSFGPNPTYLFARGGTGLYASGAISDLRLYNQALQASQIEGIYRQGLGTLTAINVTPVNASIAVGSALAYGATGIYSNGTSQNLTTEVQWSSTNAAVATISASGVATGEAAGVTTIEAGQGSVSGSTALTVTAPHLVSISLTPANQTIAIGMTLPYSARGTYDDGSVKDLTAQVAWSSTTPAVASINSSGVATALAGGTSTIVATSGSISAQTLLMVIQATLVSIAVTPANAQLTFGSTQQYAAIGTYSDGSTQNVTSLAVWSSSNQAVASINGTGLATGVNAGDTTIGATVGGVAGSTVLTVTAPNLVGFWAFDDGTGTTAVDGSGGGHTAVLMNGATWTAGQIGGAVAANGTNQYISVPVIDLTSTKAVTWTAWINRSYGNGQGALIENSDNFNNSSTGLGFFPDDSIDCGIPGTMMTGVSGDVGYTLNCYAQPTSGVWHHFAGVYDKNQPGTSAVSLYIDGLLQTPVKQWRTATNTNSFGANPTFLFARGGSSNFLAGKIDDLRLFNQALQSADIQRIYQQGLGTLTSILVSPPGISVGAGATLQMSATGVYSTGVAANLTAAVAWSSTNTAAATISSSGVATGVAAGTTTIVARAGSVTGSTGLTVNGSPTLQALTIVPSTVALIPSGTAQLAATGSFDDGSQQNLTSASTWTSTNTNAATVSGGGLVTGIASGTATIQAAYGGMSATATVDVSPTSNLAGWWPFDDGAGTSASDASGFGHPATLVNGMSWVA